MRKLAIASGAFSLGIFLAHYLLPFAWLLPLALICALPGIGLILFRRRWLLPAVLSLIFLGTGFYCYGMHSMLTLDAAHAAEGQTLACSGHILTMPVSEYGYTRAEAKLRLENGRELRTLIFDRSNRIAEATPGDLIAGQFALKSSDVRYDERYDNSLAKGVYLTANNKGALTVTSGRLLSLEGLASVLNRRLAERIQRVFPEDSAAFFRALMLGDKSGLYRDDGLYVSLSRSGFMHIVAVSGMHVSFFAAMMLQLFGRTRRVSLVSILIIWGFVVLTGANPSAVRAGIMQTVVLLAPVFGREEDPPTSLLFALALILLGNPFAVGSVGLQLSFASLAGILLFSERIRKGILSVLPKRIPYWLKNYLSSNTANSLSVLVFTVPLIGHYFGLVTVLAPISNLLALWVVPFCFGFGYFSCLISAVSIPAAKLIAWLVSWLARYLFCIAEGVSSLDFSCLYLCLGINRVWIIVVYEFFIIAALLFRSGWKRWFFPTALSVFSLFVILTATRLYYEREPGYMTAVDVGQGQSLAVLAGDSTVVVDCGNINHLNDAGDLTGAYLCSRGRTRIDLLVLTHLHADHADGVLRLMEYLPVGEILLGPDMEDPNGLLTEIAASAARHGTEIAVIDRDERLSAGAITLELYAPGEAGDINERCLTAKLSLGDYDLLVTGDINMAAERELLRNHDLRQTELLIVGHHGSKYASSDDLLSGIGADTAVISCGYNTFGHPTLETLERLDKYGYTVYRTDEMGTVELRVP